ncbi:hypothetical protein ACP70R_021513 [Stipagrostis hirtigluma subsp. patula]
MPSFRVTSPKPPHFLRFPRPVPCSPPAASVSLDSRAPEATPSTPTLVGLLLAQAGAHRQIFLLNRNSRRPKICSSFRSCGQRPKLPPSQSEQSRQKFSGLTNSFHFSMSGWSNTSRSCTHRSASGSARRSTTNSTQPLRSSPPLLQATWRSVMPTPAAGAAAGRPPRRGIERNDARGGEGAEKEGDFHRGPAADDEGIWVVLCRRIDSYWRQRQIWTLLVMWMFTPVATVEAEKLAAIASETVLPRSLPLIISKEQGQRPKELSPMFSEE